MDIILEDADASDVSLAEPGLCKAIDTEEPEPLTAAQYSELNRIINSSKMQTLDSFIDPFTGKVQ